MWDCLHSFSLRNSNNNSHLNIPECFGQRVCLVWWWLIHGLALPTFDPACMHAKSLLSSLTLWTYDLWPHQTSLSMGFFRQEYWTGLLCPPPGDLPNPEIEAEFLMSPALAGGFFTISTTWEAHIWPYLALNRLPWTEKDRGFHWLLDYQILDSDS